MPAGVAAGLVLHFAESSPRAPAASLPHLYGQAVWPGGSRRAPSFSLRDEDGSTVTLEGLAGRPILLAFAPHTCTTSCRSAGLALAMAARQVPLSAHAAFLIVAPDPDASHPEAAALARAWGLGSAWHWLVGNAPQLRAVRGAYGISERSGNGPLLYVIDRRGFERAGMRWPFLPQFVADDLRALA